MPACGRAWRLADLARYAGGHLPSDLYPGLRPLLRLCAGEDGAGGTTVQRGKLGNVVRIPERPTGASCLGSHIDSVPNGGMFDGCLRDGGH